MVFLFAIISTIIFEFNVAQCMDFMNNHKYINHTVFSIVDIKDCSKFEFYDLNYFSCIPCKDIGENLQPSEDKFSCVCNIPSTKLTDLTIYDSPRHHVTCKDICKLSNTTNVSNKYCQRNNFTETTPEILKNYCKYKYINFTQSDKPFQNLVLSRKIEITSMNWQYDEQCGECDLEYNFHYQSYCIGNALLRPYLGYNSFWHIPQHFGELKFVAFFCMALHNNTACNQLANLCILSFYSYDSNSPCSKFYFQALLDEKHQQQIRPFLFYRKGKDTRKELEQPIKNLKYSMDLKDENNHMHFVTTTYRLDGNLQNWNSLKLYELNLCSVLKRNILYAEFLRFAYKYENQKCSLSLENLIDLFRLYGNDNFMSIFLKYRALNQEKKTIMHTVPVLIENLTHDNKGHQMEDWQLVKRFQPIQYYARHLTQHEKINIPSYNDSYKLLQYRSIRYVDKMVLHYDIHKHNEISIPILKLRYRNIELNNATLDTAIDFEFNITFNHKDANFKIDEIVLPLLLLIALIKAFERAYNTRRRNACATQYQSQNTETIFNFSLFTEFLLHLISYMSLAFLISFILHIFYISLVYLTQSEVKLALPLIGEDYQSLALTVYAGTALKIIHLSIYFWRLAQYNIFFIDWERPRCGDTNHFNIKSNLETSSVCSSVRNGMNDGSVSAWRAILLANEWVNLSDKQRSSIAIQCIGVYIVYALLDGSSLYSDLILQLFCISLIYLIIYFLQITLLKCLPKQLFGNPIQKYIEHCSLANCSVFILMDPNYGYYLHGRSPYGFADADLSTMIMQLQHETQNMCGRRGLLSDTDQSYIIVPPRHLKSYIDKLLGHGVIRNHHLKEINTIDSSLEKSAAYSSVNRFLCAFIDHGIKDMDYIIKEQTFLERVFDCEFNNYLSENKGTFYIDNNSSFSRVFLYGNELHLFILQFLIFLSSYLLLRSLAMALVLICVITKLLRMAYSCAIKDNISNKSLIDKRFLL